MLPSASSTVTPPHLGVARPDRHSGRAVRAWFVWGLPLAVGVMPLAACADGPRPTLEAGAPSTAESAMVTRAPDDATATTTSGAGPFAHDSGVTVDMGDPCALLAPPILELLGFEAEAAPVSPSPGSCNVETDEARIEVTISAYSPEGRKAALESYASDRGTVNVQGVMPGAVPALYFSGNERQAQPEVALFPDNAMILMTLPTQPADVSAASLIRIVTAFEDVVTP
jgi:hypothetical protein